MGQLRGNVSQSQECACSVDDFEYKLQALHALENFLFRSIPESLSQCLSLSRWFMGLDKQGLRAHHPK